MSDAQALGATQDDWLHWDVVLGLGPYLLPVVCDPNAKPAPRSNSKLKAFGKTPSAYYRHAHTDCAHGISGWPTKRTNVFERELWAADRRLGMCVRTVAVRAIDCDITDREMSIAVCRVVLGAMQAAGYGPEPAARRTRSNSEKWLLPFIVKPIMHDATGRKRIIETAHGRIEYLARGQQFIVAGTHTSGVRYEWTEAPPALPELTAEQFEALWRELQEQFALHVPARPVQGSATRYVDHGPSVLEIPDDTVRDDVASALAYPPLREAADDNSVWAEIGYALLSSGENGRQLWMRFERGGGQHENTAASWWEAHAAQTPRSDYRHIFTMARRLGWRTVAAPTDFEVIVEDEGLPPPAIPASDDVHDDVAEAAYLCTDLRNAQRLRMLYGGTKLVVKGGEFYVWTGTHWARDEAGVSRFTHRLGALVRGERAMVERKITAMLEAHPPLDEYKQELDAAARKDQSAAGTKLKSTPEGSELFDLLLTADALKKWAKDCEMSPRLEKAQALLRMQLSKNEIEFDRDRYLLNCLNGTVDLRTGGLRAHDPADYITRCVPHVYDPSARAPRFEQFIVEIMSGDMERAAFLQRWFGYASTGEVNEQKVVLHIGRGSNGKSTLIETIEHVLGAYAHTGPAGLLTVSASDRHPTEVADLAGRRLVTVHESEDGAVLREGLLKQATGGDRLSGRFLFKDFFSFTPTHKLQLSTNHKPLVRGQDVAIWRRLFLVNYYASYGTQEQVEQKLRLFVGDRELPVKLRAEAVGILAWLVRGAMEWYLTGLQPPVSVIEDSLAYQHEQDRVAEFVSTVCILDRDAWSPFGGAFGLYPAYTRWCRESGYHALSINKFSGELERVVPHFARHALNQTVNGVRKTIKGCKGVRVNQDGDGGGGTIEADYEDLL